LPLILFAKCSHYLLRLRPLLVSDYKKIWMPIALNKLDVILRESLACKGMIVVDAVTDWINPLEPKWACMNALSHSIFQHRFLNSAPTDEMNIGLFSPERTWRTYCDVFRRKWTRGCLLNLFTVSISKAAASSLCSAVSMTPSLCLSSAVLTVDLGQSADCTGHKHVQKT
jgi:hypothetical protein